MVCYAIELAMTGNREIAEKICPYPERLNWASCWKCKKSNEELEKEAVKLRRILGGGGG